MKQVNPLYSLALLGLLLLGVLYELNSAKAKQETLKGELIRTESLGKRTEALKFGWHNSEQTQQRLQRLLQSSPLRNSDITQKIERSIFHLSAKSLDSKALEYLLGKTLNGSYTIKGMDIKRLDAEQASLDMEIAL